MHTNKTNHGRRRSIYRTLLVREKFFIPSVLLCEQLGICGGAHIVLSHDDHIPTRFYLRVVPDATAPYTAKVYASGQRNTHTFACKQAARSILQQVGAAESATCYVAKQPTKIEGDDFYEILTDIINQKH